MAWPRTSKPSTRELLRAEHRLQAVRDRRSGRWVWLALLLVIGALLALRNHEQALHAQQVAALAEESRALRTSLEQRRLQGQESQATQEQLLRRIATLSAQVERLQTDLAFFRQQKKAR